MSTSTLDSPFDHLEAQLQEALAHLRDGDPAALQCGCAALQQLAVECMQLANETGRVQLHSPSRVQQTKALAAGIAALRESLWRRLAHVEGALEIVVPRTRDKATYAGSAGYGRPVRQSGAFTVLRA